MAPVHYSAIYVIKENVKHKNKYYHYAIMACYFPWFTLNFDFLNSRHMKAVKK